MSVNITVSGKFAKPCNHQLLIDPQEAKKAEEKERRKLRLLQVREESKKLAKKIRDEVNEEKKRELKKLQTIKQKELECWRQQTLQQKNQEYSNAIFQVGTAHEAARMENQDTNAKQKKPQGSYKDFKKQMAARKCQPEKVTFNCQPFCPCQLAQPGDNKYRKCTCTKAQDKSENTEQEAHKRKRNVSFSSSESDCEDEGYKEQTLQQSSISLSSTCDSTMSSSEKIHASKNTKFVATKNKCLIKTPAVCLDVEVGSDDSITISAPAEVKDNHCKYNRQFSSVIRLSPRRERHKQENTCENPSTQPTSTTTTLFSETTEKEENKNKSCLEKPQNSQFNAVQMTKEKRFTIISELVKKQQENKSTNVSKSGAYNSNSQATSANITPLLSPRKQIKAAPVRPPVKCPDVQSPRKTSATSKSSRTLNTQPLSLATAAKSNSAAISSSSSGRVQFYDYNSKLAKEQDQSATSITVQRQRNHNTPSAMEQAEQEKQKERERQFEELKKLQQMEERGQKALEREQMRRDCNELTEKLEILSQEYPKQMTTNENQLHIYADKQLRKEGKMNSVIEKLLQRPSIITCSEQIRPISDEQKQKSAINSEKHSGNILNVGCLNNNLLPADDVTSDSCCSILLGYVDVQSKQIKQDIQKTENGQNQSKQKRLKDLLKRLDNLRNALLEELSRESTLGSKTFEKEKSKLASRENNLKQVFDSISELRKEHEEILINEKDNKGAKSLREREKLLKAKEELLERKVREFFELQNQPNKTSETQVNDHVKRETNKENNKVCATGENPLEILITVKGDTKCVKIPQKPKRKITLKKTPSKISTLIKSPQSSLAKAKKHTPKKKIPNANPLSKQGMLRRQNSYDSNSTSYMSLPTELPTKINDLVQAIEKRPYDQPHKTDKLTNTAHQTSPTNNQQQESDSSLGSPNIPPARVNPLIAQYVHRLLGMSRSAVQMLGVSSSDMETPSPSIINTADNIALPETQISEERLMTLQSFIEENKSFIKDVEQSIRSQNNVSLETSLRKLDDIWRQRLKGEKKDMKKKNEQSLKQFKVDCVKQKSALSEKNIISNENKIKQTSRSLAGKSKQNEPKSTYKESLLMKDLSKSLSSHYSAEDKESGKSIKTNKRSIETVDKAINAKLSIDSSKSESDTQMARYAKLTENCTHRIAELTELINRVREEKQRLLEVTLSSVSDNGRHSTEYLEFPEGKTSTRSGQDDSTRVSSSSEDTTQNKQSVSLNALHDIPKLSSADKNKQLANSRDSGIADSRPVTALDNRPDQEPLSQTSSESTHLAPAIRKMKPPPTLKRFSPQLPENELAHELSTIFEVDTPATSRINTAIGQSAEEKENAFNNGSQPAIQLPTFEQYIEKMNLDMTQINAAQNLQLQQEFTAFLECLQQNKLSAVPPQYSEFPSITAYLQQLAECDFHLGETLEESLAHISGIQPAYFPPVREYIQHNVSKTLQGETQQLLDTESLENITDANTDNDTASLDIQAELKKRNIIKHSFRVSETRKKELFSSTAHTEGQFYEESGIDKLSTSGNTSDLLDNDLKRLVQQFSREQKKKSKEAKILSSTTRSTNASSLAHSALKATSVHESSKKESGRPFNVRDFLTRELEKHINSSSTSSSIDDSLRSCFLQSLLGSLTPLTPAAASKSGGQTLDRQKTSTPVPVQSSRAHSSTSSQTSSSSNLFSGESRLSSVHYQNRSEHGISSGNANADQSSE